MYLGLRVRSLGGSLTLDGVVVWVFQRRHGFGFSLWRMDGSLKYGEWQLSMKDPRRPELDEDGKAMPSDYRAARATGNVATSTWKSGEVGLKLESKEAERPESGVACRGGSCRELGPPMAQVVFCNKTYFIVT